MEQTIIQIGNSAGVILRKEMGIKPGDKVLVTKNNGKIIISPVKKKKTSDIDAKFAKIVEDFMDEHADVLEELAKR